MEAANRSMLRDDEYYTLTFKKGIVIPWVVRRQHETPVPYDPVQQSALTAAQIAAGTYTANIQLGLNSTVTSISNVTNFLKTSVDVANHLQYQVRYGIDPELYRLYLKQPNQQPVAVLSQAMVPSSNYPDVDFWSGKESPYGDPSEVTEFIALNGLDPMFDFYNPYPVKMNPHINFRINIMRVDVVTDPEEIRKILLHQVPERNYTVGETLDGASYQGGYTAPDVEAIPRSIARLPPAEFAAELVKARYITADEMAKYLETKGVTTSKPVTAPAVTAPKGVTA